MSGPRELFEQNLELIERICTIVCRKNGCRGAEAEDFASQTKLKLLEDDCARLAQFNGESRLKTYLKMIVVNQFRDYRNHVWGKWRPSTAAERLGGEAIQLEQLVERDGRSLDDAIEILKRNHHVTASREELREIWRELPPRTKRHVGSVEAGPELPAEARADDRVREGEQAEAGKKASQALLSAFRGLDPEDRLLLKMRFKSGLTVATIARTLGKKQRSLYSRLETLGRRLRLQMEAQGVTAEEARRSLGWDGWDDPFGDADEDP